MSVLNDLLEYQRVDGELRKIEQEIAASDERKKAMQAKAFVKNAESRIAAQDKRAVELKKLRDELALRIEETTKAIAEYADVDELLEGGADVSFYKRNAQQLLERVRAAKGELNKVLAEVESLSAEYKKMMEQGKQMNRQYKEYAEKFRELQASRAAEIAAVQARLQKIGASIPENTLERYKQKRKEKIFPVIVPLTNNMCICGMDLPLAQQGRLAGGNVIECEHCHRFIYKQ